MRSTARWLASLSICMVAWAAGGARADEHKHDHSKLPPGPIRDRHELMEAQGQEAKDINEAFDLGSEGFDVGVVQQAAQSIAASAHQIPSLFPKGSTDPNSRALPAIWEGDNFKKFTQLAKQLEDQANSLANAAAAGSDENLQQKANKMFATCKSCHDQFRKPEEKKKGK
jgi:cytochrome c556